MSLLTRSPRFAGAAGAVVLLAACMPGPRAQTSFRGGLEALEASRMEEAYAALEEVRRSCGTSPLGQQAVLVEAAAALAGGVRERDPRRAALLTAAFLRQPRPPAWGVPLAESLYLMSRELGAPAPAPEATSSVFGSGGREEDGERPSPDCGARWEPGDRARSAEALPRLHGEAMVARVDRLRTRLAEMEALRDSLTEMAALRDSVKELEPLRDRVKELEKEVERLQALLKSPEDGGP